jgi:hypothetical protein
MGTVVTVPLNDERVVFARAMIQWVRNANAIVLEPVRSEGCLKTNL